MLSCPGTVLAELEPSTPSPGGYPRVVAETGDVIVRDNPDEQAYEVVLDGSRAGVLHYLPMRDALVLVHTEVAPELEGRGLGGRLISGALEDVRARGLRLVPVCPFVASYLERHPEYADLVGLESDPPAEGD